MKALEFVSEGVAKVTEHDIPEIAEDEVLIASRAVGVCHSDIELLEGRYIIPFSYPIIPGHEWSGEVMRVGSKVTDFKKGDHVVGDCVIGDDHFGFSISGAAAEFFITKAAWLHKIPNNISWNNGALVEPFSVGYYALMRVGNVNASDTLVVLGAGPIGLAVTAASKALGARTIVVEPVDFRQKAARELGADIVCSPEEIKDVLAKDTEGRGANVVVEATGRPDVMATALELVGFKGRVAYIGIDVGKSAPAQLGLIQSKELTITGSIGSPGVWEETIRFMSNKNIDLSPLVTSRFTVDEALGAVEAAQRPMANIKAHIEFNASV